MDAGADPKWLGEAMSGGPGGGIVWKKGRRNFFVGTALILNRKEN